MAAGADEADLFRRFQNGDEAAFKYFYAKHVRLIQYIGGRFRLSDVMRDDLVQEVFLKMFKARVELRGPEKVQAWLAATARHWVIDHLRQQRHDERMRQSAFPLQNPAVAVDDLVHLRITAELVGHLAEKLRGTAGYEDFVRFYFEGKTVDEIAEMCGEAVGTVTSRLTRLRARLRVLISAHYGKDAL